MSSGPSARAAGRAGDLLPWQADMAAGRENCGRDTDITVIPDGEQATLMELAGVYVTPPGAGLDPGIAHQAAASHVVGSGRLAASSASMNGHRCIRWPLIFPDSISTT
jgi:hypothetical protein